MSFATYCIVRIHGCVSVWVWATATVTTTTLLTETHEARIRFQCRTVYICCKSDNVFDGEFRKLYICTGSPTENHLSSHSTRISLSTSTHPIFVGTSILSMDCDTVTVVIRNGFIVMHTMLYLGDCKSYFRHIGIAEWWQFRNRKR